MTSAPSRRLRRRLIERGITRAADHAGACIAATGAVLLAAYVFAVTAFPRADGRILIGDATHHFVQLRSVVFDRDLHFQNDYTRIYRLAGGERGTEWVTRDFTEQGYVRNYMPVGPALLWAPLYLLAVGLQGALAVAGGAPVPDGFDRVAQLAPGVTGILAATLAAWISYRLATRYTRSASALVATLGIWLGTHALYYSLVSPAYSHTASILTSALFFSVWLGQRTEVSVARAALWGGLAGACALMRWQDALFVVLPVFEVARWNRPASERLAAAAAVLAAWLVVFSPQMVVWQVIYGRPFALPQGPAFMQWTSPHLVAVLVSDNHGLLSWAPLLVLALIGLVRFLRMTPAVVLPVSFVVLSAWYVNAAVADWWAGEAFGARRFLSLFPMFVLGLAVWLHQGARADRIAPARLLILLGLGGANLLLLLQYQLALKGLEHIAPYPHGVLDMWLTRFIVPFRLLAWWAS
jgi:hypothetical protein